MTLHLRCAIWEHSHDKLVYYLNTQLNFQIDLAPIVMATCFPPLLRFLGALEAHELSNKHGIAL